jgi:outer membrane protein assembly factor BamB/protein-S-isoprenylcysteine O-methyltransferase Ste14
MVITPLKHLLEKEEIVFIAKVKEVLPEKPAMVLVFDENLRGKAPFERMPVNLTGDKEAKAEKHTEAMLDRIEKDLPILIIAGKDRTGKKYIAFGFTNGTWFQMEGTIDGDSIRWSFLHCEPYLRRTFSGTTAELKQTIAAWVKDKKELPKVNDKEKPGFGPAIKKSTSTAPTPLFGVIQLPFLGLIAGLAALFPTVFGGLALFMKRWVALLSTAGIISLIYFLFTQFPPKWIAWTGLVSIERMWLFFAALSGLGGIWAASRYRRTLREAKADDMQPRKADRVVLVSLLVICLGILVYAYFDGVSFRSEPWPIILIITASLLAGSLCAATYHWQTRNLSEARPHIRLSVETMMLWALVAGFSCVSAYEIGRGSVRKNGVTIGSENARVHLNPDPLWVFEPKDNGKLLSVPCVTKDAIYVSVYHNAGLEQFGRVYAVDPKTGAELWRFGDDVDMKPVFCSPVYADGKVYVGEGFHKHAECRIFCLDAKNKGKLLWEFKTGSHAESTPCVSEGKVVFGAGNDGIYCLNAETGKEIWHYTAGNGVHIDGTPVIWDGKVYCGSGLSRTHQVNQIFCLNLADKKEVWPAERVEMSCYGAACVYDGQVFYGLGNSTFSEQRDPVSGYVFCRDAKTGAPAWECQLPNTVIAQPAADKTYVYVGCYDGNCYAIHRRTTSAGKAGTIAWKTPIGAGPIVAGVVAEGIPEARISDVIYVAGREGVLTALDPHSGALLWNNSIPALADMPNVELDAAPVVVTDETYPPFVRRIYVGAALARGDTLPIARLYCFEEITGKKE